MNDIRPVEQMETQLDPADLPWRVATKPAVRGPERHAFQGPYQGCTADGCDLPRESAVHDLGFRTTGTPAAHYVERYLAARGDGPFAEGVVSERVLTVVGDTGRESHEVAALTTAHLREVLAELHATQQALVAALAVAPQPGAGDYNRALADVRAAAARHLPLD